VHVVESARELPTAQRRTSLRTRLIAIAILPLIAMGWLAYRSAAESSDALAVAHELEADIGQLVDLGQLRHDLGVERALANTFARLRPTGLPLDALSAAVGMDLESVEVDAHDRIDAILSGLAVAPDDELGQEFLVLTAGLHGLRAGVDLTAADLRVAYDEIITVLDDWVDQRVDGATQLATGHQELAGALASIAPFGAYIQLLAAATDEINLLPDYLSYLDDPRPDRTMRLAEVVLAQDAALDVLRAELPGDSLALLEGLLNEPINLRYQANRSLMLQASGLLIDAEPTGQGGLDSPLTQAELAGPMVQRLDTLQTLMAPLAEDAMAALVAAEDVADTETRQSIGLMVLITSATLGLVVITVRSVSVPLARLEDRARRMGSGEVHLDPLGRRGPREVAVVAESFDKVMRHLTTVDAQTAALADNDLDRPVLGASLPGPLGRSIRRSVDNLAQTTAQLRSSEEQANALIDTAPDAIFILRGSGVIERVNDSASDLIGLPPEDLVDRPLLGTWLDVDGLDEPRLHDLDQAEGALETSEGLTRPVMVSASTEMVSASSDHDAAHQLTTVILRDISGRKELENELAHRAHHDSLTLLPNRAYALETLDRALSEARRTARDVAVLFVDLDRFKSVNDTFGHQVGDRVLRTLADRFQGTLRSSEVIARLGGDEFLVVATGLTDPAAAIEIASRLQEELGTPIMVEDNPIAMQGSIGISYAPCGAGEPDELVSHADLAAYQAKASGSAAIQVFDDELAEWMSERKSVERSLRLAMTEGEMEFHHQPIVRMDTGRPVILEALARWDHRERGLLGPDQFLPIIEESHLVIEMGRWAIEEACRSLQGWPDLDVSIAVNVSGRHVIDGDLVGDLALALDRTGAPADRVIVELTERHLLDNLEMAAHRLDAVSDLGIRIALDDFGTGPSSLTCLRRLPVDLVKVDRSFVAGLTPGSTQAQILQFLQDLAATLDIEVVAEGVETAAQIQLLDELGCTMVQGFYVARPMPAAEVAGWFQRHAGQALPT
jgi:diguanylate cyclase (GGDEF)-like protein/PAS domain S-box-containing protein